MGGMKAYNTANQSEADLLLAENVEALSAGDEVKNDNTSVVTKGLEQAKVECSRTINGKKEKGNMLACIPINKPGKCILPYPNKCQ